MYNTNNGRGRKRDRFLVPIKNLKNLFRSGSRSHPASLHETAVDTTISQEVSFSEQGSTLGSYGASSRLSDLP